MEEINWECALVDVMDIIFKFLNPRELCNMATVCKSWLVAVNREKAKRCYFEQLTFKFIGRPKLENHDDLLQALNNLALDRMLHVQPYASLLIDNSLDFIDYSSDDNYKHDFVDIFKKKLPCQQILIVLEAYSIITSKDIILQSTENRRNQACQTSGTIFGLFFPKMENQSQILMAAFNDSKDTTDDFIEELGLNNCEYPKSTILLFFKDCYFDDDFATNIITKILERVRKGEDITWTVAFSPGMSAVHHDREIYPFNVDIIGLRICSSNVNSWRTVINIFARPDEVDRKLQELKKKVVPGRHCTGLISSISPEQLLMERGFQLACDNRQEIMHKLKCIFPDITFLGFFHECVPIELPPFNESDIETIAKDVDSAGSFGWFFLTQFIWVMIISYD